MSGYFNSLVEKTIGGVYLIAEACDNHMGSVDMAIGLIDAAKYSGANAVKFQHHLADHEMLANAPMSDNFSEPLYDFLKRCSLSLEDHFKLFKYCNEIGITYLCTPFSWQAAQEINELVPFFKIGSGEFQDYWYINKLSSLKKPVLFSTGMCSNDEIYTCTKFIKSMNIDFALLNCLSEYPPNYADLNLGVIPELIEKFPNVIIGHSDHTPEIHTSIIAASMGARIIEKHLTFSEFVPGPDKSVSISPIKFKELTEVCRYVRSTLGSIKEVKEKEAPVRLWAYRSIVSTKKLNPGDTISVGDICTKRPGTGIPSANYQDVIGKKVIATISENEMITREHLGE
jgi:sialic acid synthase SpsE